MWPTYSYAGNVGADSLYLIARNLLVEATDPWTMVVPEWSGKVPEGDVPRNVTKVARPMLPLYRTQEAVADPEVVWRFAPTDGPRPVEICVSMSPARTLALANAWRCRSTPTAEVVLVNWDLLVRDDKNGEIHADDEELVHQAAGCAAADLNVFESPVAKSMALDICRKYLSPSLVRKVIDSSVDVPQGIPVDRMLAATTGIWKRPRFSVYYGGRFSTSKRIEELAEVIDALYRFGRDVDFVVTTGSLDGAKREKFMSRFPEVELHVGLSQEAAWQVMASCHASVCFSTHELFGMAFWEQMAAGLAVVMKAASWNEKLLPPGYDLTVTSAVEAGAKLRALYDDWRARGDGGVTIPQGPARWVQERYDSMTNMRLLLRVLTDAVTKEREYAFQQYATGARGGLVELAQEVLEDGLLWTEYVKRLREKSRVGANVVGAKLKWARSNAMLDAYRIPLWLGWEDVGAEEAQWASS